MRKFHRLILVAIASVLILLTTACVTNKEITHEVVYVVPEVVFPVFPDPTGNVELDDETGIVSMSMEYYTLIFDYKVKVDEAEAVYSRIKNIGKEEVNDDEN